MTQIFNKQQQLIIRRKLRQEPIICERKLWNKLRNNQLGYKFRRQYGIGKYVVDFYCPKLKLAIEVDGATHSTDREIKKDIIRQKFIESLGVTVKRYYNSDIKENLSGVIYSIQETCEKLSSNPSCPSPCKREGTKGLKNIHNL